MGETHVAVGELAYSIETLNVIKVEAAELHSFESEEVGQRFAKHHG